VELMKRQVLMIFIAVMLMAGTAQAQKVCPQGMGLIPAISPYTGSDWCMQTTEAVRVTLAGTWQWNNISQTQAETQCAGLFTDCVVPVNQLWQAALHHAEGVAANWTGGSVGSGALKTDLLIPNGTGGFALFEDMGDGHWEFVRGTGPGGDQVVSGYVYTLLSSDPNTFETNGLIGNAKFHFGPAGTYGSAAQLGVTTNRASSYIMRGGDDSEPGAFGVALNHAGNAASDVSFRCACPLATCGVDY
jgi:hypothetical protein